MDVKLAFITVDPVVAKENAGVRKQQGWERPGFEDPLLDGPVSRRVAVVDIDPETGALAKGAKFLPEDKAAKWRKYDVTSEDAKRQVSVFTTVLRVLDLFERPDALGRRIRWAFAGEQLLIVPRAGEWANAFYERESKSLQLFFFTPEADTDKPASEQRVIYTCVSPDIVAHESGHAVLDAIAPDLYDAVTPQALALHEAIADLVAAFFTFEIADLREHVLKKTGGDLTKPNSLGLIAEEFGAALEEEGAHYLRSLYSGAHIDASRKDADFVAGVEPHDLSVVFSAAVYQVLVGEHARRRMAIAAEKKISEPSASGLALYEAGSMVRRILVRALDYLPPGDASFADLGRAMVASDAAAFPRKKDGGLRKALAHEFLRRGIVPDASELDPLPDLETNPFTDIDIEALVASDWVAYQLVEKHRALLGVPKGVSFEVRPRLRTEKTYYRGGHTVSEAEIIFKISWTELEAYKTRRALPKKRRVRRGVTIVIDPDDKSVRLRLSNAPSASDVAAAAEKGLKASRDVFLETLIDEGVLAPVAAEDAEIARKMGLIPAEIMDGALRVRGLGRMLHLRPASSGRVHAHVEGDAP